MQMLVKSVSLYPKTLHCQPQSHSAPGSSEDSGLWSHCPVEEEAEVIVSFQYLPLSHCLGGKVKLRPAPAGLAP